MYIKKLHIENFRNISCSDYDFKEGINVIIGDNGTGKTAIIKALCVALGGFILGVPHVDTIHIHSTEFVRKTYRTGDGSTTTAYPFPVSVTATAISDEMGKFNENISEYTWTRDKQTINDSKTRTIPHSIDKAAFNLYNNPESTLPLILYQSATRPWQQAKNKKENVFTKKYSRSVGYTDCLLDVSNMKFVCNWCEHMEQISFQQQKKIREYESAKNALAEFLSILLDKESGIVSYDRVENEMVYDDGATILPIQALSSGYQSLIDMVLEIACRISMLNPHLLENAYKKTDGIVLVDEIDLHLHPKWQWKVLNALHETFPRIQFIVTTHSPIIISSCENVNIIMLNNDALANKTPISVNGWQVNDVLSKVMNAPKRNPKTQKLLNELKEITAKRAKGNENIELINRYNEIIALLRKQLPEDDISIEASSLFTIAEFFKGEKK